MQGISMKAGYGRYCVIEKQRFKWNAEMLAESNKFSEKLGKLFTESGGDLSNF
jgi:hypothetical protein